MNRRARRATADEVAAILAWSYFDIEADQSGPSRIIADPLAVRALERGVAHLLSRGGEPQVMRLSEEEPVALAPWTLLPTGWSQYMTVGLNTLGRASYITRAVQVEGASPMEARRMIEDRLLLDLRSLLRDTSPLPIPEGRP